MLDITEQEKLCERALSLGDQLRETLLGAGCRALAEVRGRGSMLAAEFHCEEGKPCVATAAAIQRKALEQGVLLLTCDVYGNVICFLYPLWPYPPCSSAPR